MSEVIKELNRLLRKCGEGHGCAAVVCERMEGAREARADMRAMIRERIRELEQKPAASGAERSEG